MSKIVKIVVAVTVVAGGAVGAYAWLAGREGNGNGFKLVDVSTGSITAKAVAVGKIEPRLQFKVKSKISGIVRATYFEVGQTVRPGDYRGGREPPDPALKWRVGGETFEENPRFLLTDADWEMVRLWRMAFPGTGAGHLPEAGGSPNAC